MKPSRGFTVFDLFLLQIIVGLIAFVTIPTFLKFQARSKQSEAKANLKALWTAEMAYRQEKDIFSTDVGKVGFEPERGNRYQYNALGNSQANLEQRTGTLADPTPGRDGIAVDVFKYAVSGQFVSGAYLCDPGAFGGAAAPLFVGGAQGQIDEDLQLDVWTISTADRAAERSCLGLGTTVPAGTPYNEYDDVDN